LLASRCYHSVRRLRDCQALLKEITYSDLYLQFNNILDNLPATSFNRRCVGVGAVAWSLVEPDAYCSGVDGGAPGTNGDFGVPARKFVHKKPPTNVPTAVRCTYGVCNAGWWQASVPVFADDRTDVPIPNMVCKCIPQNSRHAYFSIELNITSCNYCINETILVSHSQQMWWRMIVRKFPCDEILFYNNLWKKIVETKKTRAGVKSYRRKFLRALVTPSRHARTRRTTLVAHPRACMRDVRVA
jgi:hypothetical protein